MVKWLSFKNVNIEGMVRMILVENRPWFAHVFCDVAVNINILICFHLCSAAVSFDTISRDLSDGDIYVN